MKYTWSVKMTHSFYYWVLGVGQQLAPRLPWSIVGVLIFQRVTFPINLTASRLLVVVFTCWKWFFFVFFSFPLNVNSSQRLPLPDVLESFGWTRPCYWLVSFCYCWEGRETRRKKRKSHNDRWNKWDCEVYNIWLTLSCDLYMTKIPLKYQGRWGPSCTVWWHLKPAAIDLSQQKHIHFIMIYFNTIRTVHQVLLSHASRSLYMNCCHIISIYK